MNERRREILGTIAALMAQTANETEGPNERVVSAIAAAQYLEALTRSLVDEACEAGASWDDLGNLFGTTGANVKARFGAYRTYDDEAD
ncbi:MAG: hypothetical protein ACRD0Q_08680 [Acidimicrobiales bacterium]